MTKEEAEKLVGKRAKYKEYEGELVKVGTAEDGAIILGHLDNGIVINIKLLAFID